MVLPSIPSRARKREPSPRLGLPEEDFRLLLAALGPSLGLWRAAEIAALRRAAIERPVMDLGCGDGFVASLVLPRLDVGVDPDARALDAAAGRGAYDLLEACPVQESRVASGTMATVISNSVLEHVEDVESALGAAARVLRRGGRLVFTVPTEAFSRWLAIPGERYAGWRNRRYVHRNLWTVERWRRALETAGLRLEETRPYLRRRLVALWDALDLAQQARVGGRGAFGLVWKRLPGRVIKLLARAGARLDLAARHPGGGRLMVARKA